MALDVPIAFCIFNRPELTEQVFEAIARQRPRRLFVIGDGPRTHVPGEAERVAQTREIIEGVNWPCNVQCRYSNINMGCRQRIATGLTWAFGLAERLIILEDDTLPCDSFFGYCESLLDRYESDPRVMMISGDNFQPERRTEYSYYFSRWAHIWGWASWRRAWQHFDIQLSSWSEMRVRRDFANQFENKQEFRYWSNVFDGMQLGEIDTWDFAWAYACWANGGLTILPEVNLVTNLGFGENATHTLDAHSPLANLPTCEIGELRHPEKIERHQRADRWTYRNIFQPTIEQQGQVTAAKKSFLSRIWKRKSAA